MIENLDRVISLMEQTEFLGEQLSRSLELRKRLCDRELVISVIGKFKSGKSSLINGLLNEELLPTGIIPLTTVVTEIRRGKNFKAVVSFTNGDEKEVSQKDLLDYISEQKNPDNEKQVSVVKLWTSHAPFDSDITLVDTPGVGSIHLHNTETSHEYIEKSDAVIFLLSVDSPVSQMELDFLLKARKHAAKFYFAVNKIDGISEEDLEEFMSYCKEVLSEAIGLEPTIFPISAKTGLGLASLKTKLNYDLKVSYNELLEASVLIKFGTIIAQAKSRLDLYIKASKIPTQELETKMSQIKAKQLLLNTISDEFQVLVKSQTDKLVLGIEDQLDEVIPNTMLRIETRGLELYEDLKSLTSKQFEEKFTHALENVLNDEIKDLNYEGLDLLQEGYETIVGSFNKKAVDAALYISQMMMEYFGVEYPVSTKTYTVSERNDNYIRLTLYKGVGSLVHLLPSDRANEKIFKKLMIKAKTNLDENQTRIISNYRYKMRESIRSLSTEFTKDISNMMVELDELLTHMEKGHNIQGEELLQVETKHIFLIEQLDALSETSISNV